MKENGKPEQALVQFLESLTIDPAVYFACYDVYGNLQASNHPEEPLQLLFTRSGCQIRALELAESGHTPAILTAVPGLAWGVIYERTEDDVIQRLWVLGPAIFVENGLEPDKETVTKQLSAYATGDIPYQRMWSAIQRTSVLPLPTFSHLCQILHFYVTGEKVGRDKLRMLPYPTGPKASSMPDGSDGSDMLDIPDIPDMSRMRTIEMELRLMTEEYDINYQAVLSHIASLFAPIPVGQANAATQAAIVKTMLFTIQCVHASIDSGMRPEDANALGELYLQLLLVCKTVTFVQQIRHEMFEAFVSRLQLLHTNPGISPDMQACMAYINAHVEDELRVTTIVKTFGYDQAYLSRRFRYETGLKITDYIHKARVERAKQLLETTNMDIGRISARLHFASTNHFSEIFKEFTGYLPADWRRLGIGIVPDRFVPPPPSNHLDI